jgi:transcriptional regulator with XRE-family HTH domain
MRGKIMASKQEIEREKLGSRLKEAREYVGLSQDEVARALKIPRAGISLLESGQRKVEAIELKQLAELYRRPAKFFTGENTEPPELPEEVQHLAREAAALSDKDRVELARFAEFLKARASSGKE